MEALRALGNMTYTSCEVVSRNVTLQNSTAAVSSFSPLLCGLYGLHPSWRPGIVFLLVCFLLMSILGNGCLVGVIATREAMQEPGNIFLAALALNDIFSCLLGVLPSIHNTAHGRFLSGAVCKTQAFLMPVLGLHAHSLLLCLWVCRYVHIVCPIKYARFLTRRRIAVALALNVAVSFLPSVVGAMLDGTVRLVTYHGASHMESAPTSIYPCLPEGAPTSVGGAVCVIMMAVSTVFNILIYREAQHHKRNLLMTAAPAEADVPAEAFENKLKAAKTLSIVLIVYWVTWLPSGFVFFLSKFMAMSTLSVALDIVYIVNLTSQFSDSLVYAFRYDVYRKALVRMFRDIKDAIRDTIFDYMEIILE